MDICSIILNSQNLKSAFFDFVDLFGDGLAIATRPRASKDDGNPYQISPYAFPRTTVESIRNFR
jgi:hypothetical protein